MKFTLIFFISILFISCSGVLKEFVAVESGLPKSEHQAKGKEYAIASQGRLTTLAGKKMYEMGGNAIDAAVAMSFVVSVERPQSTGLGGGGFMLIKHPKKNQVLALDFREKAPLKSREKMYQDSDGNVLERKSKDGIFSVGVPGLVSGIIEIHQKYGSLPLSKVMAPAIVAARDGFPIYKELARALKVRKKVLMSFPSSKKIFFKGDKPLQVGDQLVQRDLAKTLEIISLKGKKEFYQGSIAKKIVAESRRQGGLLTMKDFRKYQTKYRKAVEGNFKSFQILSMSPPSSGGIHIIQILNTVENDNLKSLGPHHPNTIHLLSAAMQQAFADRARHLGDSDFVSVPVSSLVSKSYAKKIRKGIQSGRAKTKKEVWATEFERAEPEHTTHFSIMDKQGFAISSTQTINGYFGSGLVATGTGIVLNNEMDDFSAKPGASNLFGAIGGSQNKIEPEKRPLSSMSPTIVMKNGEPLMSLGTPNGTKILTCVTQVLLNFLEHEFSLYQSVATKRYHHQWSPDEIRFQDKLSNRKTIAKLEKMGYSISPKNYSCRIQAVGIEDDHFTAVSDMRGFGKSIAK